MERTDYLGTFQGGFVCFSDERFCWVQVDNGHVVGLNLLSYKPMFYYNKFISRGTLT